MDENFPLSSLACLRVVSGWKITGFGVSCSHSACRFATGSLVGCRACSSGSSQGLKFAALIKLCSVNPAFFEAFSMLVVDCVGHPLPCDVTVAGGPSRAEEPFDCYYAQSGWSIDAVSVSGLSAGY